MIKYNKTKATEQENDNKTVNGSKHPDRMTP